MSSPKDGDVLWVNDEQLAHLKALAAEAAFEAGAPVMAANKTLRDWFAGQYLAGIMACPNSSGTPQEFAKYAYEQADAMLEARKGRA